jgi:cysteine synthase
METSIVPGIYDPRVHDRKVSVFTEDAYEMCCRMAREEGILVGYSCGAAVHGVFEVANGLKEGVWSRPSRFRGTISAHPILGRSLGQF